MDNNEAIVDQIVRNLSFEVVTVPQHVIQVDSTSKSTPLNVKIRVRKKHGAELRYGVLSMPKVDTRSDNLKKEMPDRVRLVSSDQTIMNFDMLMEADFDKTDHKQNLNMVLQGEVNDEEDLNTKNVDDLHTAQILPKKNRDIFGKCKPGGCLDPPFGEDKYSYQPTQQNHPVPVKDDAEKLRSSSIFKNNIFKRKKKSSQSDDVLNKPYTKNKKEVDSKTNSNVKDSLETCSPYFNAIITYPHPSDSNEFPRSEEKKINREVENSYRKKNSSDERSKSLIMENGSYFILPKKTKNLSNQSHLNKMQTDYTKAGENNLNIIKLRDEKNLEIKNVARSTGKNENTDDDKADESKLTTQARTFIPVPLIVPLNAIMNSKPTSSEMFEINSKKENITKSLNNITQKEITMYDKNNLIADQTNLSLQGVETLNSSGPVSEIRISTVEKINHIQILRSIEPQDMSAKQDMIDKLINNHESKNYELDGNQIIKITTSKENFSKSNEDSAEDTKYYLDDQTDFKSGPLLAVREKSLLDIIVDQAESNSPQNQSEKYQDVPFTSQDLSHIWENETKALKSMADVITKRTMLSTNNNDHDEEELLKFEKTEKPAGEVDMKQKTQLFLHETTSKTDLQAGAVTPSNSTKTSTKDVTKEMLFNKEQNVIDYTNVGDAKIPTFFVENKEVQNHGSETRINKNREDSKTQEKIFKNLEKLVLTETNIENKENVEILKSKNTADAISKYDEPSNKNYNLISQKNMINKQNDNLEHIDDFNFNKEEVIKVAFKEECPSFSEDDDITIKGLFPYSKQSISDQSIMGSGSSTYIAGNTSGKEDDKLPKINSKSNPEETIYVQTRENEILNDGALKQIPYMTLQNQKVELKTQFESMNDTGELNIESGQISLNNLPEVWYKASETTPPAMILRKDVVPWKIDLALQSYLDENNEKIIKSFNSTDVPERRLNDAFLVARCYLGDDLNEIKIPIDQDNNLTVKIVNVRAQHRTLVDNENVNLKDEIFEKKKIKMDVPNKSQHLSQASIYGSSKVNDELYRKNKIKINVPVLNSDIDEEYTDYEEINKAETNKYNNINMNKDLRNTLNSIYEQELVPLQSIIKGLREEIDALAAYQMKLNVQNLTPKRSKPFRLVHTNKKCCNFRRL